MWSSHDVGDDGDGLPAAVDKVPQEEELPCTQRAITDKRIITDKRVITDKR
jgi:hypothetical protein